MGIFSRSRITKRFDELDKALADSFSRVRDDTNLVFQWITYLNDLAQQHQRAIEGLANAMKSGPKSEDFTELKAELRQLSYELSELKERLNRRADSARFSDLTLKLAEIEARIASLLPKQAKEALIKEQTISNLKERVVKKLARSSKEYIKHAIKSLIAKYGKISALELRDIIVEEQRLCSKSTFYRLLEEIEGEEDIAVIADKKAKNYMQKMPEKTWK